MYGESSTRLPTPLLSHGQTRENSLLLVTPMVPKRRQHHGQLLPIENIQRSRQRILEFWPEDDRGGKLNNMYLDGRNDKLCAIWKIKYYQQTWRQSIPSRPQLTASAIIYNKGQKFEISEVWFGLPKKSLCRRSKLWLNICWKTIWLGRIKTN